MNTFVESILICIGWVGRTILTIYSTTVICHGLHIKSLAWQLTVILLISLLYTLLFKGLNVGSKKLFSRTSPKLVNHFRRWLRLLRSIKFPVPRKPAAVEYECNIQQETESDTPLIDSQQSGVRELR